MFTQHFGKFARVDARNAWHLFAFQPVPQTFHSIPMTVLLAIIAHDYSRSINAVTLHVSGQFIITDCERWHTIIAHKRICKSHELSCIRRVCQTFGITHHGCVENHFACYRSFITKRLTMKFGSVVKNKCYVTHIIELM